MQQQRKILDESYYCAFHHTCHLGATLGLPYRRPSLAAMPGLHPTHYTMVLWSLIAVALWGPPPQDWKSRLPAVHSSNPFFFSNWARLILLSFNHVMVVKLYNLEENSQRVFLYHRLSQYLTIFCFWVSAHCGFWNGLKIILNIRHCTVVWSFYREYRKILLSSQVFQ